MHFGVKGMKWGIRKSSAGTTSKQERHVYNKSLRRDKGFRRDLEYDAWEKGKVTNLYKKKQNRINKKYNKALEYDPEMKDIKTKRLSNTKRILDQATRYSEVKTEQSLKDLRKHVDEMINKYSDTKIKDVETKTLKSGVELVKSKWSAIQDSNAVYSLNRHTLKNPETKEKEGYYYTPKKTRYY